MVRLISLLSVTRLLPHVFCVLCVVLFSQGAPINKAPSTKRNYDDGTANKTEYTRIDDMLFLTHPPARYRAGQWKESYRWPNGKIPYSFAPGYSDEDMRQIYYTMKYIETYSCIRFGFRSDTDENFLYIRNVEGKCQSFVGNVRRGAQQVALDPESRSCAHPNFPGHVLHELIHAIGFFHEHARDDRDEYIEILYENLSDEDDILRNFYKNSDTDKRVDYYGVPYNYGSIMHYSEKAGSLNGEATISRKVPLPAGVAKPLEGEMGQREYMSKGDAMMVRNMYKDICPMNITKLDRAIPDKLPDVLEWVTQTDVGEEIDFPVEVLTDDDDDDGDDSSDLVYHKDGRYTTKRRRNEIRRSELTENVKVTSSPSSTAQSQPVYRINSRFDSNLLF